ncbi:hypothetical protein VOLCADRAFT_105749 [Volvox carteri f. nagariensis]|uniref:Importin N-terminal domain-containing protein n=1 Tax=Volvox carteri f. nagariensis TaxID=3068 RepID=D8U2S4_VOLCA|nr:uncharacterized protein VOLCADRAFT_105749 [Volvox carteri f. nagariensis]EFJ45856.1 hypothetical protein VOLCADRAFT_105749 [Volvox carteri f. nagariensis]|eukprot:XP_002952934.1 hypothetical protein VOLCADRAFT_105749 [Volvox carteri f. nagariensis]
MDFPRFEHMKDAMKWEPERLARMLERVRQLAAVLLKQVIKKHWSAEAPKYEEPELSRDERTHIQTVLPQGLSDASSKVRTAVAMCIAAISKTDPDGWPGLVENLVGAIHAQRAGSTPLVHGAIRCLSLLSDDIDEQQLPQVARALLPELLPVVSDTSGCTPEDLRSAALSIFHDVIKALAVLGGVYQRQEPDPHLTHNRLTHNRIHIAYIISCSTVSSKVRDLLVPLPLNVQDTSGWAVRMLCLKSLTQLISYFSKPLQQHMALVMQVSWGMFTGSVGMYQMHLVLEPSEGGRAGEAAAEGLPAEVDSEGNSLDLESLLAQLFELLMVIVGLPQYAKLIRPALPEMSYLVVSYMQLVLGAYQQMTGCFSHQMTASQATEWLDNPAQYVADEEDNTFTVRVSGELLVDSLMQAFGMDAAAALLDAVERRMQEAAAAQAAGQAGWKLREAALLAAGCCAASFPGGLGEGRGGAKQRATAAALQTRLQRVVDEVLRTDLQGPLINPLLVGRAMWLAARLQPILRADQRGPLLAAATAGLNSGLPSPVKIGTSAGGWVGGWAGACRALASLAPRVPPEVLGPLAESLYGGLLGLLAVSGEDALNLVLESMVPLIKADPAASARALPALSTPLLQVWSRYVNDPLIAESSLEVLAALARVPQCLGPLAQQVLPVVSQVVRQPAGQSPHYLAPPFVCVYPDGLAEGCLDLLCKLVRPAQQEVVAAVAAICYGPLLALLPGGPNAEVDDDTGALTHGATELLVELLRAASLSPMSTSPTSASAADVDAVFAALLATTLRMLDPAADEYRTSLSGDLAAALVRYLPSRAAAQPALGQLLAGCCRKLAASNLAPLVGGLLAALSHMALAGGAAGWLEALGAVRVEPPQGAGGAGPITGLQAVLPVLLERHSDVRGALASRVVCLALLEMLRSCHPLLMAITVPGKRQDLATGVRTRRQAAAAGGEQWTAVPAAVKVAAVVSELLVDQPWLEEEEDDNDEDGGSADDDDEEEYGEDDEDDDLCDGDEADGDEEIEDGDAMNGSGDDASAVISSSGSKLRLSGKGINQREPLSPFTPPPPPHTFRNAPQQSFLDTHINRSPILPADSAVVDGCGSSSNDAMQTRSGEERSNPLMSMDLRTHLLEALRPLQQQPDTAAFLAAALDLLPQKKHQKVLEALTSSGAAAAAGAGAGGSLGFLNICYMAIQLWAVLGALAVREHVLGVLGGVFCEGDSPASLNTAALVLGHALSFLHALYPTYNPMCLFTSQTENMNPKEGHSWDNLTADLVERVVSFLDPNEVVCTVKEINKAMASQFREKVAIRLSQPVPHHAFNRHWSRPEAVHNFVRDKRRDLLLLTARSGSLANLQVAVKAAGCKFSWEVLHAAAEGGNLEMCQWLQGEEDFLFLYGSAAVAAARSGHLEMARWLLQEECNFAERERAESEAFEAASYAGHQSVFEGLLKDCLSDPSPETCLAGAARGGHVGLTHWLLQQFEPELGQTSSFREPWKADIVTEAAYGFDLAALQHLHRTLLTYGGDGGNDASSLRTVYTLVEALVGPTPDWRAKVEWLQAQGCRFGNLEYFNFGAIVSRPDSVERVQRLLMEVAEKGVVQNILIKSVQVDNLALIRYLRAGRDWLPERTSWAVLIAVRAGNMALLVELVNLGWRLDEDTALAAVEEGHLHILKWIDAGGGRKLIQEVVRRHPALLKNATSSGNVEFMEWLLNELDVPWSGEELLNAAVEAGSPALLEWLVARGFPMGDDGELYVRAARYHDLLTLRCLRRLGCPWGPDVFSRAVYDMGSCTIETALELLQWLHAEGCPVDWEEARSRAKTRISAHRRNAKDVAIHDWIESIAPS